MRSLFLYANTTFWSINVGARLIYHPLWFAPVWNRVRLLMNNTKMKKNSREVSAGSAFLKIFFRVSVQNLICHCFTWYAYKIFPCLHQSWSKIKMCNLHWCYTWPRHCSQNRVIFFMCIISVLTAFWVVINSWAIKFKWFWLCVDEYTDRTIESDRLFQLACIAFCDVHVKVELCSCCGVFKMAESLLKRQNHN